jgi:hypothetical protein
MTRLLRVMNAAVVRGDPAPRYLSSSQNRGDRYPVVVTDMWAISGTTPNIVDPHRHRMPASITSLA